MLAYMDEALSEVPGVRILRRDPRHTARAVYCYIFAIDPEVFGVTHDVVCDALVEEGIPAGPGYEPMHRYDLFQPQRSRLPVPSAFPEQFELDRLSLPQAERASEGEAVWLSEAVFRSGQQGVDDVVSALQKIYDQRTQLAQL
jgi:dTDP-4-amino-4,6-dideoxygalactose transaminase